MSLKDRVALITGANRGIGKGIALELARGGADIVVGYRSHHDEAEETAAAVRELGSQALVVRVDVSERAEVDAMAQQAMDQFGRVDIGVCNAAVTVRKPFLELTNDDFQRVLDVSLLGVFSTAQAAARQMVDGGRGGSILIISSVMGAIPAGNSIPYNTSKAGINHMAHTMAAELAPHRIRVNVIEPGWTDTPGERAFMSEERIQREAKKLPWGRLGTIEELGHAARFLASDEASYITAATLRVDGGYWLPREPASTD